MSTEAAAQSHAKTGSEHTLPVSVTGHDEKEKAPAVDATSTSPSLSAKDSPVEGTRTQEPEDEKTPVEEARTSQHAAALGGVDSTENADKLQAAELDSGTAPSLPKSASDSADGPQGLHESDSEATAVSAGATSPTLDALLSPKEPEHFPFALGGGGAVRESVAETDITDTDDEGRFSTVPLSARGSLAEVDVLEEREEEEEEDVAVSVVVDGVEGGLPGAEGGAEGEGEQEQGATLDGNDLIRMVHTNRVHKKTASTSTIMSANNVPFIVARLEGEGDTRRKSADGEEKIKQEFGKKHSSRSSLEAEMVDWSECIVALASRARDD